MEKRENSNPHKSHLAITTQAGNAKTKMKARKTKTTFFILLHYIYHWAWILSAKAITPQEYFLWQNLLSLECRPYLQCKDKKICRWHVFRPSSSFLLLSTLTLSIRQEQCCLVDVFIRKASSSQTWVIDGTRHIFHSFN